jgi:hypothetical protein
MTRKWYKWPEGYVEEFVPWYVALRRLVFFPTAMLGKAITYISLLGGWGLEDANCFWKDTR